MSSAPRVQVCLPQEHFTGVLLILTRRCSHLRILIHRNSFLKFDEGNKWNQVVTSAACRISRIAEDMSTHGTLRYGQMHL